MARWEERVGALPTYGSSFWVGHVDPGATLPGLYIVPRQNLRPLLHDTAANLMPAAQYALGGFQKMGISAFLPPLQTDPCPIGMVFLRHIPRRFQRTQLRYHRRWVPYVLGVG